MLRQGAINETKKQLKNLATVVMIAPQTQIGRKASTWLFLLFFILVVNDNELHDEEDYIMVASIQRKKN